jgi:GNAT superfamily N-acetyltransferase
VGPRLTVRPYDAARDTAALAACIVEHQDFHRGLEPSWPEGAAVVEAYVSYLRTQCQSHDGCVLVAERDGDVLGFVCVVAATRGDSPDDPGPFAWIHDIFVREAHRRGGLGTALLAEAEAFARSHGARRLRLGVLHRNEDARAFYRAQGFRDYVRIVTKEL